MTLIEKFVREILNNKGSFTIEIPHKNEDRNRTYHFLQDEVGKARYVYGISNYWDANFYAKLDIKPKIIAIVVEGKIYVVDIFFLEIYSYGNDKVVLPDNVLILNDYTAKQDEYISNILFPNFYAKLETDENSIQESDKSLREKARSFMFSKNADLPDVELKPMFNDQDVANMLCGFMDFNKEVSERFNEDKERWIEKKSTDEKIKALMGNPEIADSWEIEIANGIRSVEAKTVTVEFELNGKVASIKINPETIIRKMINNDYFSGYDFEIAKRGDKLIDELGAGKWRNDENALRCKHITKIVYGKKELYVRK